jgi:plastocyanin
LLQNISKISRLGQITLLAIATLAASGCSGVNAPANPTTPATTSDVAATAAAVVNIANSKYQPKNFRTKVGVSVKFLNKDFEGHTVTADDLSYTSPPLSHNKFWRHTFTKPGRYPYHCKIHPYMTGTVIVTRS